VLLLGVQALEHIAHMPLGLHQRTKSWVGSFFQFMGGRIGYNWAWEQCLFEIVLIYYHLSGLWAFRRAAMNP
jgi:hypothetical protein